MKMIQPNEFQNKPIHTASAGKRMGQGAGVALVLIVLFLASAGAGNPEWPRFWMIRPLVIVPLAGALGGVFYYNMDHLRDRGGWRKVLANVLSLLVFLVVLWLGTVLGLDGTWWD